MYKEQLGSNLEEQLGLIDLNAVEKSMWDLYCIEVVA